LFNGRTRPLEKRFGSQPEQTARHLPERLRFAVSSYSGSQQSRHRELFFAFEVQQSFIRSSYITIAIAMYSM
jgi:hypothetical protein